MVRNPKAMYKIAFFLLVIVISLMSGALLHANAGSSTEVVIGEASGRSVTELDVKTVALASAPKAMIRKVDVCPGDTLWSIAAANLPEKENVRSYMAKIKKINGLKTSDLQAGQILTLP